MAYFAILVWLLGTPMFMWFGYMIRLMENPPKGPVLPIDRAARTGKPVLLFGPDGQIVEASWVTARQAARRYGGKVSDYSADWLTWEEDTIGWTPRGYMPKPTLPPSPLTNRGE